MSDCNALYQRPENHAIVARVAAQESGAMRRSLHTEHEILFLLCEADAGVPIAEICSTAGVSLRTFYRWRERYGGLSTPALRHLKELEIENRRLRSMLTKLAEREPVTRPDVAPGRGMQPQRQEMGCSARGSASVPGQTRGASVGRFASVRCMR
jgi:putative transposase